MLPDNVKPETAKTVYAELVAKVKAEFAKKDPRKITGEQVTHEIQKRWAKRCGEKFDAGKPAAPSGNEPVATVEDRSMRGARTMAVGGSEDPFDVPIGTKPAE